jgi:hypothetical protein
MALTELKSTLSNFRKPMPENPLIKKGADKVTPIKATDKDLTLSKTSNLGAKDVNKSQTNLSNTKFNSNIKTSKMGIFDSFTTPDINKNVSIVKEKTSNIQVVKSTQGINNNTSNINVVKSAQGANNNTSTIKTISVNQNKLLQIMNSGLDIDSIPVKYTIPNTLTQDTSNFNLDYTPPKYINTPTALRFGTAGTGLLLGASNLDIDSIPTKYQNTVGPGQFSPFKVAQSNLDVNSIPNKYTNVVGLGKFDPFKTQQSNLDVNSIPNKYINIVGLGKFDPFNSTQSGFDINNIPTKYQNIVGLGKFDPFNSAQSNFDINNIPTKYQNIVGLGQFDPFKIAQSQLDVNSIPAKYQNIVGLGKFTPFNPVQSQLDVNGIPNKYSNIIGNGQFNDDNTIIGNRWRGNIPPAVNFFAPDTNNGAKGFTTNMTNTQFNFINGNQYAFTNTIERPLSNGVAKLDSQLGLGSRFNYTDGGAPKSKVFSVAGYSSVRKYGDIVKSNKQSPDDSLLYKVSTEANSPSALDLQYAKFNLQDDSYNPFYINQPFILRGIQRKGNKSPQRWGGSSLADDGFIRGGIAAAVERSAFDVARLAQWAVTPKGLLWVTKQVGLGLSNPRVETIVPTPLGQTRIHSGIASLLSVPTTAFGVHFTKHGMPFLNEVASYGNVQEAKEIEYKIGNKLTNRLIQLRQEIIRTPLINKTNGLPIASLSYFGGPNSAYGIGFTTIKRAVNSNSNVLVSTGGTNKYDYFTNPYTLFSNKKQTAVSPLALDAEISSNYRSQLLNAAEQKRNPASESNLTDPSFSNPFKRTPDVDSDTNNFIPIYSIKSQYASVLSKARINTTNDDDNKNITNNVDEQSSANTGERSSLKTRTINNSDSSTDIREASEVAKPNPFSRKPDIDRDAPNTPTIERLYIDGTNIRNYSTIAYNQIPKNPGPYPGINDFRSTIEENWVGDSKKADYANKNLEKNGWGTQGAVGADRSDYTKASGRGDKVNLIGYRKNKLSAELAKGDYSEITPNTKDFIAFYFSGPKHHADVSDDVIIFRANIQGFSDAFSPEWSTINIMGRADKAYIYTGFERSISFTFMVAATSRDEMKPMWQKINFLSTYTMPDYNPNGRMVGPFMRITIGNLFQNTPIFLESLNIAIPDDATWETNLDGDPNMKQLPTMAEISVTAKVLADYRPQKMGRAYSLSTFGKEGSGTNNWLSVDGARAEGQDIEYDDKGDNKNASTNT